MRKTLVIGITLLLLLAVSAGCSNSAISETQADNPSINADSPSPDTDLPQIKTDDTIDNLESAEALPPAPSPDSFELVQSEYIRITSGDALNMEATYLDVRTQEEYEDGHIPGAILLPVDDINEKAEVTLPDKDRTIVVYCRSGVRSERAAKELIALGYKKVFDLGGINYWTGEIIDIYGRISYNYFGKLPEDKITPISFSTEKTIASDNDLWFRFTLEGEKIEKYEISDNNPSRYSAWLYGICFYKMTIENPDTGFLQEITDLETINQHVSAENMYGLSFDDWNFDGYLDMSLWRYPGGSMRNNPSYYWLWDMDAFMFVSCEKLDEISSFSTPEIVPETNQLYAYSRAGWPENMRLYYEWQNGQLVLVKSIYEYIFEHPDGKPESLLLDDKLYVHRYIIHELRDGEMVLTEDYYFVLQDEEIVILDDFTDEDIDEFS